MCKETGDVATLGKESAEVLSSFCASAFGSGAPGTLPKLLKPNAGSPAMKDGEPKATGG